MLSPAGDPAVLRADGQRAADGAGRSQLLDHRRGDRVSRAAPAAAPLSRAVWDDQHVGDMATACAANQLDDRGRSADSWTKPLTKSFADCDGAARQYSGTVGVVALCQVAVTLTYATGRGHALIGHALYLPEGCAADEEHRELAGVQEELMLATKPQLAAGLLNRAQATSAGPRPPAALVGLAPPPPIPRSPSPSPLERLRRDNTMITTNYSCSIKAHQPTMQRPWMLTRQSAPVKVETPRHQNSLCHEIRDASLTC